MGEGGGAVGRVEGGLEEAVGLVGTAHGDAVLHAVERAGDALQDVVEVVRQAAGELADRLHLLRLPQRLLGQLQLAGALLDALLQHGVDVDQRGRNFLLLLDVGVGADPARDAAGGVLHRHGAREMPVPGAVVPPQAELGLVGLAARQREGPAPGDGRQVVGMHQVRPAGAVERPRRGAAEGVDLVVEPVELAVGRCRPDMVGHRLRHGAKLQLAGAQLLLGALLRRDVEHRADEAHGLSAGRLGREEDMTVRGHPALDAVAEADRAVFDVEGRADRRIEGALHGLVGARPVVGMKAGQEHVVVHRFARRQAEQGAAAVVPQQDAAHEVVVERAEAGGARRQPQALGADLAGSLVAHPLDVRPRAFGDLADRRQFVVGPGVRRVVMHRHQRRQPAFLDQRHADRGGDADRLEGGGFFRRELAAVVAHDQRPASAEFRHRLHAEIGQAVVADDAGRARRAPVAADGEAVLVGVHVGIGADRGAEMLAGEPRRRLQDSVGVVAAGGGAAQPVEEGEPQRVLAHRRHGALALGDVGALDEDADDRAGRVAHRLVDEVEQALLGRRVRLALQRHRRGMADEALAAAVDLIEQLVEALARDIRQRLADRPADHVAMVDQLAVGGVGDGEDMVRAFQPGHEGGGVLEHLPQPLALRRGVAARQHALGGLDDDGDHAARPAFLGDHRRIEEVHPAALGRAAAVQDQLAVLVFQRAARHADRHDVAVEVGHFRPGVQHRQAQKPGMAIAGEGAVGVVVEHDAGRSPQQHQRHRGMQHEADGGPEAGRPAGDRPERARPVVFAHQAGHLAVARQESRRRGGLAIVAHASPTHLPIGENVVELPKLPFRAPRRMRPSMTFSPWMPTSCGFGAVSSAPAAPFRPLDGQPGAWTDCSCHAAAVRSRNTSRRML